MLFSRVFLSGLLASTVLGMAPAAMAREADMMVQMTNYEGKPAYFALYLVDPSGRYVRTLWVSGKDAKYQADLPRWSKYLSRAPQALDAITGASTGNGDRAMLKLELDDAELNAGYKLRVETAVEDQKTFPADVEAELADGQQGTKLPGTGYVRFVRFKWQ
jgi:Predicted periplasmic protein (DUF2271)